MKIQSTPLINIGNTEGIKDYTKTGQAHINLAGYLANGNTAWSGTNWYGEKTISYTQASYTQEPVNLTKYNGTLYQRVYNAADDMYEFQVYTKTLYSGGSNGAVNFTQARLDIGDANYGHNYKVVARIDTTGAETETKTMLAQSGSTATQNFAFDIGDEEL